MENQNVSPTPTAMRWGALLGLVGIAVSTITYSMGGFLPENADTPLVKITQFGMYAIIIFVLVIALQQHRDRELGGYMKYSRGLGLGTLIGLFYGIIAALAAFIIFQFLMPSDYIDRMLEVTRQKMLDRNPNMPDDQVESALNISRNFMTPPIMALFVLGGSVFMCFLFSLLVSAFVKKNNPDEII